MKIYIVVRIVRFLNSVNPRGCESKDEERVKSWNGQKKFNLPIMQCTGGNQLQRKNHSNHSTKIIPLGLE